MINLRDARITDGLPRIVAEQPWAQVLSAVYGELQDRMFEYLDTGMTFSEVDTCDEGVLEWIHRDRLAALPRWEGDRIFLELLRQEAPFFSLKLRYEGERLAYAALNGREMER